MIKRIATIMLSTLLFGCTPMTISKNADGGCTLSGFGGGKGAIEDVCSMEKGMLDLGGLRVNP